MRRLAATLVLVIAVVSPTPARAAGASCAGSAPTTHNSLAYPVSPTGLCTVVFDEAGTRSVTISIAPGSTFTGTLQAAVRTAGIGFSVKGFFVAGTLVYGGTERTVTLGAGSWQLEVFAGASPPCLPYPLPCPQYDGFAIGDFSGSVS